MAKTLTANPLWGLQGVPARIVLERNGLTIKTGVMGGGKTIPYSNISNVDFSGMNSVTLSGTIEITPFRGQTIKLNGFSRSDYNLVKDAVDNGSFDDGDDGGNAGSNNSTSKKANIDDEYEQKSAQIENKIDSVVNMDVNVSDESELTNSLYKLINVIEAKENVESHNVEDARKDARKKFNTDLRILKLTYPNNKLIPFFESKIPEWAEIDRKKKKQTLYILLGIIGCVLLLLLIGIIAKNLS